MNLNLLKVFIVVSDTGNFSKAAKELFLSQPAVSQMMKELEEEVDCKLFIRQSRGVKLTREGIEFYRLTKIGISALYKAKNRIKEMKLLKWGNLRLGASDTISRYILPKHLKEYSNRNPNVRISIRNGTSDELENMLNNGEIDLVIGFKPKNLDEYEFNTMMTLHEAFVTSKDYRDKLPKLLTKDNISKFKIMMLDVKSQTRKEINNHLIMQNININPIFELANYELLSEFAKQGLGVAILAKELIEDLQVIDSDIKLPKRDVGIYFSKKMPLSYAANDFIKTLL